MNTVGYTQPGTSGFMYLYAYTAIKYMIKSFILKYITLIIIIFLWQGCRQQTTVGEPYAIQKVASSSHAMVVTAHPLATDIGVEILERGGNAVDAAVAVQFALAVVYPIAGNIGGGGFMLIRDTSGEASALDFREKAPMAAYQDLYLDSMGQVMEGMSTTGHLSVGVPGAVDGMWRAHQRYGRLPWKELLAPAMALASEGILLTSQEAAELNAQQEVIRAVNAGPVPFIQDIPWRTGDRLVQTDLGTTLQRIADAGRDEFYLGETARLLVRESERGGGILTMEDLAAYEARWREPLIGQFQGMEVISMPPPSSGGVALLQLLKATEHYPLDRDAGTCVQTVHLMTELERRVYADRAKYLGDPDFVDVPMRILLDSQYIMDRLRGIRLDTVTPSSDIQAGLIPGYESDQTTHFSILDADGMAVSTTTTLNLAYGSKVVVQGAGFFLNNEMDDFSIKPGVPNYFGLIGYAANAIEPGKRMLSSMTPTIVVDHEKPRLIVGSPGGSKIITTVYQIILQTLVFGQDLPDAVAMPRYHHQWRPDTLFVEHDRVHPDTLEQLRRLGHRVVERSPIGRVDAIWIDDDGSLTGAADLRGDDSAKGF